mmetsp:Transcript_15596/g.19084  ORF Transcript_15596/g.19084 Transcript_15596/m.19084 type:complete len:244 (+) Transcript_15596:51-782(+)
MSGMVDKDATKRIQQMIAFIKQEAKEKAEEIRLKADEEFQIEKGRILNPERLKLNQEFDRKFKDLEIKRKIEFSTQINKARLKVLEQRGKLMTDVETKTFGKLNTLKNDKNKYKLLIKNLIIQGLIRMDEINVKIECLKDDLDIVQSVFDDARNEYKKIWKATVDEDIDVNKIVLDKQNFVPPASVGGVIITARNGKIRLDNTLESRLKVCQQDLLPQLRGRLFGVTQHIGVIYDDDESKHHE